MKMLIVLVLIAALVAPMCHASSCASGHEEKSKDPVTATVEAATKTVQVPVEAVFGGKKQEAPKE